MNSKIKYHSQNDGVSTNISSCMLVLPESRVAMFVFTEESSGVDFTREAIPFRVFCHLMAYPQEGEEPAASASSSLGASAKVGNTCEKSCHLIPPRLNDVNGCLTSLGCMYGMFLAFGEKTCGKCGSLWVSNPYMERGGVLFREQNHRLQKSYSKIIFDNYC